MTGHLINDDVINSIQWADAEVVSLEIVYDSVNISILESNSKETMICCEGHIGFKVIGFWDETIIKSASLEKKHPFIEECFGEILSNFKNNPPMTGNNVRNEQDWQLLNIILIDNVNILIVCGKISLL